MDRRNFLRAVALGSAAFAIKDTDAMSIMTQSFAADGKVATKYDLVAVMGGEPEVMFRKAIAEIGGMGKFIKKEIKWW